MLLQIFNNFKDLNNVKLFRSVSINLFLDLSQ